MEPGAEGTMSFHLELHLPGGEVVTDRYSALIDPAGSAVIDLR
jgi:hypothetical protein